MLRARPEFGPPLATLVRGRFGVRERITIVLIVAVVAMVPILLAVRRANSGGTPIVHRGTPTFALGYDADFFRRAKPQEDELVRLELRRRGLAVEITAKALALRLPRFAALPVAGSLHIDGLRRELADFQLAQEGKARIGDAVGYQAEFRYRDGQRAALGRDLLLFPSDTSVSGGVLLTMRQTKLRPGPLSEPQRDIVKKVRRALRSFAFGTDPI